MGLQLNGRIMAGNDLLDADLRDIEIISGGGGTFLYAATGQNGGVSVYHVDTAGGLANLSDIGYYSSAGITMGSVDVVSLDGAQHLFLGGTGNGQLIGFGVKGNGDITGVVYSDLPGTGVETERALADVTLLGGRTALYMVDGDTGRLAAYLSDGAGAIVAQAGLSGKDSAYDLGGVVALETVVTGGAGETPYLVAADADTGGVRSYRIDATTGALEYVASLGAANGLGVGTPSAMQVVQAHGASWIILAAAGSGSLSVMKLSSTGQLEPADHILDTLATRFGGVTALAVTEVDGHVFVFAGGADDGISLFSLLPGGRLVHMQSLAHTSGAGLENVTGINAVQMGDEIQIFVTSGAALGLSQFSLSLGELGTIIQSGGAGGGQVLGTGAGDLILGQGAQDRLMGQGGDDILVSAAAGGILSGGAGADIFVLCPSTGILEISDFEPGADRLDLTGFAMLRSLSQLDLTPTGTGIEIGYGTTLIVIHSFDGTPLSAAGLWPTGFDTPDRVPIPDGPVMRVTRGTPADDTLILGLGQDTVRGLAGDDTIRGGTDKDRLIGGGGADRLFGGSDRDSLKGGMGDDRLEGQGGNDTGYGEDGRDRLIGGGGADRLFGGNGRDILAGDKGDDTLRGDAGDDTLKGGQGDDTLRGGDGHDTLIGGPGQDDLNGKNGQDSLDGRGGHDILRGGDKADTLLGGRGDDRLIGGAGADTMTGGTGRDVFIFSSGGTNGHGADRISDFTQDKDNIRINIDGVGFDDLILTGQASDTGVDTLIDTGFGTITLTGVAPGDLAGDDFLFF